MEGYPIDAVERAMKVHEVILQARAGKLTWIQAAEILGITPRSLRRWRKRARRFGEEQLIDYRQLLDRRRGRPSPRRVPGRIVDRILTLYRDRYRDYNVRHFHETVEREHGITQSYTFVKQVLQGAGLVRKYRARGKHRQRRERRACFGEMLHLDGSRHHWLALAPTEWQCLISVVDDATGQLLYAQFWSTETRHAVMAALDAVFREHGLPQQVYTDRAGWAARTPRAGGKPDANRPTQVEQALAELGVEHLRAYSPQARGRSERVNRTHQGRLVNELRTQRITNIEDANRYLEERYRPHYNERFRKPAADPTSGFVAVAPADLERCLCIRAARVVQRDNTLVLGKTVLQIPRQEGRRSCQGLRVQVRQYLDGHFTVQAGVRLLGRYDASGRLEPHDSQVSRCADRRSRRLPRTRSSRHVPKNREHANAGPRT